MTVNEGVAYTSGQCGTVIMPQCCVRAQAGGIGFHQCILYPEFRYRNGKEFWCFRGFFGLPCVLFIQLHKLKIIKSCRKAENTASHRFRNLILCFEKDEGEHNLGSKYQKPQGQQQSRQNSGPEIKSIIYRLINGVVRMIFDVFSGLNRDRHYLEFNTFSTAKVSITSGFISHTLVFKSSS